MRHLVCVHFLLGGFHSIQYCRLNGVVIFSCLVHYRFLNVSYRSCLFPAVSEFCLDESSKASHLYIGFLIVCLLIDPAPLTLILVQDFFYLATFLISLTPNLSPRTLSPAGIPYRPPIPTGVVRVLATRLFCAFDV